MGISDGGDGGNAVDGSVGTIVWVRRRNGSWWPGRVLGHEELSASHLMSPRSGTPVKLLGREDASVDWYNLEKSKRVKAFRCGEFDACIERAEASQGVPIKKREKYARREDAILHALELEKQQFGMKPCKLGTISNGTSSRNSSGHRRELHDFSSDIYTRDDETRIHNKISNYKSHIMLRKAVLSGEEENKSHNLHGSKGKSSKQSIWEENNDDSLPRKRGLQDFGLGIAPPKKKFSQSVTWEASRNSANAHVDAFNASPTISSINFLAFKRKRSQGGYSGDSLVKKRDRRHPLVKVLQSSAKLPLPVSNSFQPEFDPGGISVLGEGDCTSVVCRAKGSRCVYHPGDSNDYLDDNGHSSEEMPVTSTQLGIGECFDYPGPLVGEHSSSGLGEETESDLSETDYLEPDTKEDGNLTDTTHTLMRGSGDCESPVFQVLENYRDPNNDDMPIIAGSVPPSHLQDHMMDASTDAGVSKWHLKGKRNMRNLVKRPLDQYNGSFKGPTYERTVSSGRRTACQGYGNWKYPFSWHGAKDHIRNHNNFIDSHLEHWDESDECLNLDNDGESMLIDVDIEVQKRSYQGEHVPWVSLSSKWNGGKPILGHPVQIEILEDGSTGHLVSRYDASHLVSRYDAVPPAFMRTAKRSVMHRTPRSKPKYHFQKKHLQKIGNSNQKTKTLSSLATEKLSWRSAILDGWIKQEGGAPSVTCVPLKVVFSRILEALGRPSSVSAQLAVRGLS